MRPRHFDYSNVWLEDASFAANTFVTITSTMQPQARYLVIQALLGHVDTKSGSERGLKGVILEALSRCVGVAADESIGEWAGLLSCLEIILRVIK